MDGRTDGYMCTHIDVYSRCIWKCSIRSLTKRQGPYKILLMCWSHVVCPIRLNSLLQPSLPRRSFWGIESRVVLSQATRVVASCISGAPLGAILYNESVWMLCLVGIQSHINIFSLHNFQLLLKPANLRRTSQEVILERTRPPDFCLPRACAFTPSVHTRNFGRCGFEV